jgi:hypothetical protein
MSVRKVLAVKESLLQQAVAAKTLVSYGGGWSAFARFCELFNCNPLLPSKEDVCNFVAYLTTPTARCKKGLAPGSIKVYLDAVALELNIRGLPDVTHNNPRLHYLRFAHKKQYGHSDRPQKRPLTFSLLEKIYPTIDFNKEHELALFTGFAVGVHGNFRPDEIFPKQGLKWSHVRLASDQQSAQIFLPFSKTDRSGEGHWRQFFARPGLGCPVTQLLRLFSVQASRGSTNTFVFTTGKLYRGTEDQFVSRSAACHFLRTVIVRLQVLHTPSFDHLDPAAFSLKSMRRGGATSMAARGVPTELIKHVGKWKSEAWRVYVDPLAFNADAMHRHTSSIATSTDVARHELGLSTGPSYDSLSWREGAKVMEVKKAGIHVAEDA